jgi:hypothetical protein
VQARADAAASPDASAARACPAFSWKNNGVPWRARQIRARGVSCAQARTLIRSYAKPRNCQFEARCKVGRWTCRTSDAEGSRFTERCTRGSRVVRWRGSYVSS